VFFYLLSTLVNYRRDAKAGYKMLVTGTVSRKYVKIRQDNNSNFHTPISERTRYFIVVNSTRYLISANDYALCKTNSRVEMYVSPHGKRVYEIQFG